MASTSALHAFRKQHTSSESKEQRAASTPDERLVDDVDAPIMRLASGLDGSDGLDGLTWLVD